MRTLIFEGTFNPEYEDGGQALLGDVENVDPNDPHTFVRVQSWDTAGLHTQLIRLIGKKIRVTVEVID